MSQLENIPVSFSYNRSFESLIVLITDVRNDKVEESLGLKCVCVQCVLSV